MSYYNPTIPPLLRVLGCFSTSDRCWRFSWGELSPAFGFGLSLDHDGDEYADRWMIHAMLFFVQAFIYLPFLPRRATKLGEMGEGWGFFWRWGMDWGNGAEVMLNWGYRYKVLHLPWGWDWHSTSYLMAGGTEWMHQLRGYRDRHPPATDKIGAWFNPQDMPIWKEVRPYRYILRSGEVQDREATISVSEMEWRMRWLRWLPWPRKISRTIDISFNKEVGEGSGSWKGGCVGCSYELRPDETPIECLRRMQAERVFR